jgi:hypothetical protein
METNELKGLWKQYDAKLEKNWNLNLKLIKDMKLEKTKSSVNRFTFFMSLTLLFDFFLANHLMNFIIDNFSDITLTAPAYLLSVFTYIAIIWSFYQLGLVLTIRYSEPIVDIQKKIEKLRLEKLKFNKFIFYISYPFVYLGGFVLLHLDITHFPLNWMIPNIALAILWIPLCNWLIRKYNSSGLTSKFWLSLSRDSSLTPESASKSLNNSLTFLKEIREFELTK